MEGDMQAYPASLKALEIQDPIAVAALGSRLGRADVHRRIVVTGGAGFIGSHLVRKLVFLYPCYHIYVLDKLSYCGNLRNLDDCARLASKNWSFIHGDVADFGFCLRVLEDIKPDVIVHLAAQTHVDNSFEHGLAFTRDNVWGTQVLLEVSLALSRKGYPIERFIHVSTDEVYGEAGDDEPPFTEDHPMAPSNPYAATKASAENLVQSYAKSFGLPVIITRSNNVYGPHQFPEKVMAKWILSLLPSGQGTCEVHGNGSNLRTYIYVTDAADALELIMKRGQVGEIYNFATETEWSNLDLARMLIRRICANGLDQSVHTNGDDCSRLSPPEDQFIQFISDRPYNDHRYSLNSNKIRLLGWTPKVSWDQGLDRTIEWYRRMPGDYWHGTTLGKNAKANGNHSSDHHYSYDTKAEFGIGTEANLTSTPHKIVAYNTPNLSHITRQDFNRIYEPAEDTFILLDALEQDQHMLKFQDPKLVFEVGSGTGCAITFLRSILGPTTLYLSSDPNAYACPASSKTMEINHKGTIYDPIQTTFLNGFLPRLANRVDLVIFNPPYVPTTGTELDSAHGLHGDIEKSWAGGQDGMSITNQLLDLILDQHRLLAPRGLFYLVAVNANRPTDIIQRAKRTIRARFDARVVLARKAGLESLYVLRFQCLS